MSNLSSYGSNNGGSSLETLVTGDSTKITAVSVTELITDIVNNYDYDTANTVYHYSNGSAADVSRGIHLKTVSHSYGYKYAILRLRTRTNYNFGGHLSEIEFEGKFASPPP